VESVDHGRKEVPVLLHGGATGIQYHTVDGAVPLCLRAFVPPCLCASAPLLEAAPDEACRCRQRLGMRADAMPWWRPLMAWPGGRQAPWCRARHVTMVSLCAMLPRP